MPTDVNQTKLMDQFIKYMEFDRGENFSDEEKKNLTRGLCFGLSVIHSYMATTQKLKWWHALLEKIVAWDGKEESLKKIIQLPDENVEKTEKEKTLGFHFMRATHYAFFHQSKPEIQLPNFEISDLDSYTLLRADTAGIQWFESESGEKIKYNKRAGGTFSLDHFSQLLKPEIFSLPNTLFLIHHYFERGGHACSIRFDNSDQQWCYYDPNDPMGEKKFKDIGALYKLVERSYGPSLEIEIASFDQNARQQCEPFFKTYDVLCSNPDNFTQLIDQYGLFLLAHSRNESLIEKILEQSALDENMRKTLVMAMCRKFHDDDMVVGICFDSMSSAVIRKKLEKLGMEHSDVRAAISRSIVFPWFAHEPKNAPEKIKKSWLFNIAPPLIFTIDKNNSDTTKLTIDAYVLTAPPNKKYTLHPGVAVYPFSDDEKNSTQVIQRVLHEKIFIDPDDKTNLHQHANTVIQDLKRAFEECNTLKSCKGINDEYKLLSAKYDEIIHAKKINENSTPAEKLESLKFRLLYKLADYERRIHNGDSRGFQSGIFGMHFSANAKWNGTRRMIIEIEKSLQHPGSISVIDPKKFGSAEKTGTLGQLFLEMCQLQKSKITADSSATAAQHFKK